VPHKQKKKLRKENTKGKQKANQTHFEVGVKVRRAIKEIGGTMPENLPTAESIKKVQKKLNEGEKQRIHKDNRSDNGQACMYACISSCFGIKEVIAVFVALARSSSTKLQFCILVTAA